MTAEIDAQEIYTALYSAADENDLLATLEDAGLDEYNQSFALTAVQRNAMYLVGYSGFSNAEVILGVFQITRRCKNTAKALGAVLEYLRSFDSRDKNFIPF